MDTTHSPLIDPRPPAPPTPASPDPHARAARGSALRRWLGQPALHESPSLLVAAAAAFVPAMAYTLNHFYHDGAFIDSWFIGWLIWRNDLLLTIPSILAEGHSFYAHHFPPILLLPTLVSHFVPLGMVAWTAGFIGAMFGLVAAAVFHSLWRSLAPLTRIGQLVALAIAIAFGVGGYAVATIHMLHYEVLLVGFGLLFLGALARGERAPAWIWFACALAVREDAGFHLFGILLVAQIICRRRGVWTFIGIAFATSVAMFLFKRGFANYSGDDLIISQFVGSPPYAHLTEALLRERLSQIASYRDYIWLPALVAVAWTLWARDPLVLAGLVACIPWVVLNVTARAPHSGTLDIYYSFPLYLAATWPLVAGAWRARGPVAGRVDRHATLAWATVTALVMIVGWRGGPYCQPCAMDYRLLDDRVNASMIEAFATRLRHSLPELGIARADNAVLAFWPNSGRRIEFLDSAQASPPSLRGNDTAMWFEPSRQDSDAWAVWLASHLANHYQVVGSNIMIASNRRLEQLPTLAPALVRTNAVWRRMRPTGIAEATADGFRVARGRPPGLIAEGPHSFARLGPGGHHGIWLAPGRYEARFELRFAQISDPSAPLVRLEPAIAWGQPLATVELRADQLPEASRAQGQPFVIGVPFEIGPELYNRYLELRAIHVGNAEVTLRGVGLVRTD